MRGRKEISKDGEATQFDEKNQPSPEAKSEGWKRRRTLMELADALLNTQGIKNAKETAERCGIDIENDEFTLEIVMTLRQIEKAMAKGDTQAYNAAMDRMKGKPIQKNENDNKHSFEDTAEIASWLDKFSSKVNPDKVEEL